MIKGLTYYVGYIIFSWLSLLESLVNIIVYSTGLHLIKRGVLNESIFVADFSFTFWVWYSNTVLKRFYLEDIRKDSRIADIDIGGGC